MRNIAKIILLIGLIIVSHSTNAQESSTRGLLDMSGTWDFSLDPKNVGIEDRFFDSKLGDKVTLPGTTDTNKKGDLNNNTQETTYLSRIYTYKGAAWYNREVEIPKNWKGKEISLFLERTRPTMVWIDGNLVGKNNNLSTPHRYDLTSYLTPGNKHQISIRVDNGESIPQQIRSSSHSCTESTQTNWNGIIGRIELQAVNPLHIVSINATPMVKERAFKVRVTLSEPTSKKLAISASATNTQKVHTVKPAIYSLDKTGKEHEFIYNIGSEAQLWSEFSPALYKLTAEIAKTDKQSIQIGLREFKADGKLFSINGTKTFLRGKHDACVFPLTAHVAMDLASWRHYFQVAKTYGINHWRFHSWCPPAACFEAADIEGIYLQPELPIWGSFRKENAELMDFLLKDGENIQKEYSNHPSFVLFALGNELGGDINIMRSFIEHFRKIEPRHLYAFGSNNFLGTRGYIEGEDFLVTCRVGSGEGYTTHARASFSFADANEGGYLNNTYPNSEMNFDAALERSPIPVIGHETGQFQIYPNYDEMKKYKGVLAPRNFEIFRKRLEKAGMLDDAPLFFKASGALSVLLYRADIEMNLRSANMAGFQLLDLQDYPGQGSAYVGILDAFMDSKGLITPEKWREFCSEVVPLFTVSKFCWNAKEQLNGNIEVANYSPNSLSDKSVKWRLTAGGKTIDRGESKIAQGTGLVKAGSISIELPEIEKACSASLELSIDNTPYKNSYQLWIYPTNSNIETHNIITTDSITPQILTQLTEGAKVLLMPKEKSHKSSTVGGLFQTDYWNYRMFKSICDGIKKPASPGTLGILTDPTHPIFNSFPTEFHTNWQWYPIIKKSRPFILDRMPSHYKPIVQVIDNIERNHKLGLIFEMKVGNGSLLICMSDLREIADKPEVGALHKSIINYMNSSNFAPKMQMSKESLVSLLNSEAQADKIETLHNISY